MKSINYLFLLSFLVGPASFVSAMEESVARDQMVAKPKPAEDSDAMKARHIQEIQRLSAKHRQEINKYNQIIVANRAQINSYDDADNNTTYSSAGLDDRFNTFSQSAQVGRNTLAEFRDGIFGRSKPESEKMDLSSIGENLQKLHGQEVLDLQAKHATQIEAGSFLPEVKKGWMQRFWESFGRSDVADAKNLFNSGNGVKGSKEGGSGQRSEDWVFDKSKLKNALETLSAEQRVDVVNDYLKNSLKGNNNTEVAGQNTKALVETLNSMLPKNEKVSVGSNGISIMKAQS